MGVVYAAEDMRLGRRVALTSYSGEEVDPCFSPDGNQVAFSWNGETRENYDIYVELISDGTPLRLTTDPAADRSPAWSPDGTQIGFVRDLGDTSALLVTSPLGGPERKVVDFRPQQLLELPTPSVEWSPDGEWLVVADLEGEKLNGISLLPFRRGDRGSLVSAPVATQRYGWPSFSPEGDRLAFAACSGARSCDLYLQDLGPGYVPRGEPKRLTHQGVAVLGLAWAPDGQSLIDSASSDLSGGFHLRRVGLDAEQAPERVLLAGDFAYLPAVSKSGDKLAYAEWRNKDQDIWKFDAGAEPVRFLSSTRTDHDPSFSPDGQRIAFVSNRSGKGAELWMADREGKNPVRLTEGVGRMLGSPRWSPESRQVAYDAQREDGHWDIFLIEAEGGQARPVTSDPGDDNLPSWSRDGWWVYFGSNRTGRYEIWRKPPTGGEAEQITDQGGFEAFESPDATTLYYSKGHASPLYARPVAEGPERRVLDLVYLSSFVPVDDGIYYIRRPGFMRGPAELRFYEFATGTSQVLWEFESDMGQGFTVSPDRESFLYSFIVSINQDLILIEGFR